MKSVHLSREKHLRVAASAPRYTLTRGAGRELVSIRIVLRMARMRAAGCRARLANL